MPGLSLEQRKTLYKLSEAIAKSEALYKERHLNIFEDDYDSDDDVDEDQIYSYYFDDHQEENDSETDINIQRDSPSHLEKTETDVAIYDIPDSFCHHATYVVDQLLYGRLSDKVQLLPGGGGTLVLSEQFSARL
jgi:hypothetical protein